MEGGRSPTTSPVMEDVTTPPPAEKRNRYALFCSAIASVISLLLGYDTGVMSGAMLFIKEDLKIKEVQVEVLAGIINFCAVMGSLTAGKCSDYFGRRNTIFLASLIFLLGSLLMGYSPNYGVLISGRCVAGIGFGYALMVSPVYVSEISSARARGSLASLPEVSLSIGVLLGYIANRAFAPLPLIYGWRLMLGLGVVPSLALALGVFAMPESPRWLALQGRIGDARKVLRRVSDSDDDAESRLRMIMDNLGISGGGGGDEVVDDVKPPPRKSSTEGQGGKSVWKELLFRPSHSVRRVLAVAVGIHFIQHICGIEAVILYSPRIFKAAGMKTKNKLLGATIGVGVTKIAFNFVATFLLDRIGRRALLLISMSGMIVSLFCIGAGLTAVARHPADDLTWAPVLCIAGVMWYVAFFSSGMGPVPWVYMSEVFPMRIRAQAAGIAVAVNRLMNGTISMTFISLYQAITIGGAFFLFAGIACCSWVFVFLVMPETKGRSLEEMEEVFEGGWIVPAGCRRRRRPENGLADCEMVSMEDGHGR